MQGFIKLHRKIQDHWLYQEERKFSRYEAWLDLIMMANHKQTKVLLGNELVQAQRGQVITSESKLMKKWKWGKSRLRTFLEILENDGMITKKSDRKKTIINIENYCIYHDKEQENEPQADHRQTDNKPQSDTIKNVKNDKNVKKKRHRDYVLLTDDEYNRLINEFGQSIIDSKIEDLDNYIGSTGKKYKDHNRTLRTWLKRDNVEPLKKKAKDEFQSNSVDLSDEL